MSVLLQPGQGQGEEEVRRSGGRAAAGLGCVLTDPVPPQVNQQRQKLQELQNLIENLSSGQDTVSDKAFEDRLQEAEKAIQELLEEAQSSKGEPRSV